MGKDIATLTLETFSDLRNTLGVQSASVKVLGQSTINDGFGGVFYWDPTSTATDNNETVIQKTGLGTGRWIKLSQAHDSVNIGNTDLALTGDRILNGSDTNDLSLIHLDSFTVEAKAFNSQNSFNNIFSFQGVNGYTYTLDSGLLSLGRGYQWPDNSGVIALQSYVDDQINNTSKTFNVTSDGSGNLVSSNFVNKEVLKFEKTGASPYYENKHFTKASGSNTITMIPPNTVSNNTEYLITIK